jgi:RNA polymerase sigma factor (TIGR02999 family)
MSDVTRVLAAIEGGDPRAAEALLPLVYEELRRLASRRLAQEKPGQTLEATALVHEAYLRLVGSDQGASENWNSRGHFFAAAAEAMRRILIERARSKQREKRGGQWHRVELDEGALATDTTPDELLALDEALERLAANDAQTAQLVKLRYFGGLSIDQAGEMLGLSRTSAYRQWRFARAWLVAEMRGTVED